MPTYLQARLRSDVGGKPAEALSEFYAAIYAQCVRGSRDASVPLLEQSIRDILNVRDAWKQVSSLNNAANLPPRAAEDVTPEAALSLGASRFNEPADAGAWPYADLESHRWSA